MDTRQILVYILFSVPLFEEARNDVKNQMPPLLGKTLNLGCVFSGLVCKEQDFLSSNKTAVHIKDYNMYAIVVPVGSYDTYCGATLITPSFVISAYHCIKFTAPEAQWQAHFEVENKCLPHHGLMVNVTHIYYHRKSVADGNKIKDDLALLKLVSEVTSMSPALLPQEAPSPGEVGVVIGYEARRPRAQSRERILKEIIKSSITAIPSCPLMKKLQMVQNTDACVSMSAEYQSEGQFCSYNPPESFADCRFDSGGPWFHETRTGHRILVGVSTFGDFYCNPDGVNGFYTSIHAYLNWIMDVLGGNVREDVKVKAYNDDNDDDDDNGLGNEEAYNEENDDRDEAEDDDDDNILDNGEDGNESDNDDDDDNDNDSDNDDDDKSDDDDDNESDDDDNESDDDDNESDDDDNESDDDDSESDNDDSDSDDDDYDSDNDDGSDFDSDNDDFVLGTDDEDDDDDEDYLSYSDGDDDYLSDDEDDEKDTDDEDDDEYDFDENYNDYNQRYTDEWVPSGSSYVVGPPFTN